MVEMGGYIPVKIPSELVEELDKHIGTFGFRSRQEFVKEAVRRLLTTLQGVKDAEQ